MQQGVQGYPVDDVIIVSTRGTQQTTLALQVKHAINFTANPLFCKVMGECWRHYTASTFDRRADYVGVAIGEGSNILKIRTHLQEILEWARAHRTSRSFYIQVGKFKAKQEVLDDLSKALDIGASQHIGQDRLWQFLCCFVILSFDFDSTGSRDSMACWNALRTAVRPQSPKHAVSLFDGLYGLVSRYSKLGGEIDYETICTALHEKMPFEIPSLRTIRATLIQQVSNQLLREKKSKKYIPDVFTAIDSVKDDARYFSHPLHFFKRPIDKLLAIDTSFLNRLHGVLHIPRLSVELPKGFRSPKHLAQIPAQCTSLRAHFQRLADESLASHHNENWDKYQKVVPSETLYIFNEAKFLIGNAGYRIRRAIQNLTRDLSVMEARIFLLTARAGQGKTNFVCDFAERFLLLYGIPCLFLTGRDLRSVPAAKLTDHMSKLILGRNHENTFHEALSSVGTLCQEADKPFVVIFDGINEHPDISMFACEFEKVIEQLLAFPFVKIIITCRSEYFSERFSNLQTASFADLIHQVEEIHRAMPERHREHMVNAYFKFFKIQPSYMSGKVWKTLENNPLLLRFFCEAYGNPDVPRNIKLPAMADIYHEVVFRKYLDKKLHEVAVRQPLGSGVGIPAVRQYKNVLRGIVSEMVSNLVFSDIPISALDTSLQPALAELIAEDVFVRKDLVAGRSVLDPDAEVINFTFDEFRDYLIADHLLNEVFEKLGKQVFVERLTQYTADQCPVAEGVSRFVFYDVKKPGQEVLHAAITAMPWYEKVFIHCIFSVEETCVADGDIQRIKEEFSRSKDKAQQVFFALMHRWDTEALPRLNIDLLFAILDNLGDDTYDQLVLPIFYNPMERYNIGPKPPYEIKRFAADIESLVTRKAAPWNKRYGKLVELLIYLFSIGGQTYDFPAYTLFQELAAQRPKEAVDMLAMRIDIGLSAVRTRVWEMLAELTAQGIQMPQMLIDRAAASLRLQGREASQTCDEMARFLTACRNKLHMELPEDIMLPSLISAYVLDLLRKR
ncbi:MAG: NACHT domain-containing protein [Syntrophales bacterium]